MALSGNKLLAVGSYWYLLVEWTATQNVASNQSTVTARVYWQAKQGVGAVSSSASKDVSITIDGTKSSSTATAGLSAGQSKLLHTYVKTVTHGSDGLKNLAISATFDMAVNLSGTYYSSKTVSGSWALDSIARSSSFTMTDKDIWAGEGATVNITKASSSFTHTVYYKFGVNTRTIATKTTAVSVPFTTQLDDLNAIPNSDYGNGDMYVDTYDGTTLIGSRKITFVIYAPSSVAPSIGAFSVSDTNSVITSLMGTGNFVQGFSNLQFSMSASGKYGSTIASYTTSFNGYTSKSTSWNHGVISKAGNLTATLTVIDSRGMTTTQDLTITILPYSAPTISSFIANRNASVNTTVNMNYSIGFSPLLINSVAKNSISAQLQYKPRTSSTWSTTGTYTSASSSASQTGISASISYDFRIVVSDKLSSNIISMASISTASVLVDLAQNGVGFGKMWEKGAIDVSGNGYIDGSLDVTGKATVGTLDTTTGMFGGRVRLTVAGTDAYLQAGLSGSDTEATLRITRMMTTGTPIKRIVAYADSMYLSGEIENENRIAMNLINNFANYDKGYNQASYWKDKNGVVHLTGLINTGTNTTGTVIATLPVGYRPKLNEIFSAFTGNASSSMRLNVDSTGVISFNGTYTSFIGLAGISFKAE